MAKGLTLDEIQGTAKPASTGGLTLNQLQAPAKQPSLSESIWAGLSGAGSQIAGAFKSGVEQAKEGYKQAAAATNPLQKTEAGMKELAGGVNAAGSIFAPLGSALGKATKPVSDYLSEIPVIKQAAGNQIVNKNGGTDYVANKGSNRVLEDINNTATVAPVIVGGLGKSQIASEAGALKSTVQARTKGTFTEPTTPKPLSTATSPSSVKIQELISPKVSAKETKLALAEGRIAPGQEPGLLRDGTPDQVIPSKAIQKAANTIQKEIPGAEDMSQPELHGALDVKISNIAQKLTPEMKKVPLTDQIVANITDAWDRLKAKQLEDPYASTGSNLEKLQTQFESKFLAPLTKKVDEASMSGSLGINSPVANMNDLWDIAKAYDQSVPANVKSASVISPETLQTQKSVWIQNRAILRGAINDASTGLGATSKTAFDTMHDLYNAQKGIQSSYKVPKEGAPSTVKSFMQKPAVKIGTKVAGAALGLEGARRVLTGEF